MACDVLFVACFFLEMGGRSPGDKCPKIRAEKFNQVLVVDED